ncbi:MAG: hypothetical protein JXR96_19940 [Deltaproteobacteria bacterium]|nr:hypothetical protein [Deltaproteobacteria bacterium]
MRAKPLAFAAVVLVLLALGVYFQWEAYQDQAAEQAQRESIERELAEAERIAAEMDARWHSAMARALEVEPEAALGPCPIAQFAVQAPGTLKRKLGLEGASGPDLDAWMRAVRREDARMGASNEMLSTPQAIAESPGPMHRLVRYRIEGIRRELRTGRADLSKLAARAHELASPSFWTHDLVVVIDRESPVGRVDPGSETFEGRAAIGRSYVFDYQRNAVVCAGRFTSTSSQVLRFASRLGTEVTDGIGAVDADLEANVLESAKSSLRRVAPKDGGRR